MNKITKYLICIILFSSFSYSQWFPQNSGTSNRLSNIYFVNDNTGIAVGLFGTARKTTNGGLNWTGLSVTTEHLYGIYLNNANTGYVCGDGVFYKTTNGGTNWFTQPVPLELYRNIYFINDNTGYACGSSGTIIQTTNAGVNWNSLPSGTGNFIQNVKFTDAFTGFAAGNSGTILKTINGGLNWSALTSGTSLPLFGLAVTSANIIYASGENGFMIKSTDGGASWITQVSNVTNRIVNLHFLNSTTGSGSGHSNIIIRTTNGGLNWLPQISGLSGVDFDGLYFTTVQNGYVVSSDGVILHTTNGGFQIPAAPNLTSPVNGALNIPLTPILTWDSSAASYSYRVQLANNPSFSGTLIDSGGILNTSFNISSGILANNNLYYWRVRGENAGGSGAWSSVFNFTTIVALPVAPGLILPANGSANIPLTPLFDWDSTSPAESYTLQASLDTSFTVFQVFINGITQSFLQLTSPQLQNNLRYYWRVNAVNAAGTGPWSQVFNFTTVFGMPAAPTLLSPPNNSIGINLTPTLRWVQDISSTSYQVQLAKDSTFNTQIIIDSANFNSPQLLVQAGLLVNVENYFWRVRTTNAIGTGPWSQVWKFTTLLTAPGQPVLLDPPDGAENISTTPTLDWDIVQYTETYRVQVSTDSLFGSFIFNIGGLTASQYNVPGGILLNNTFYYWRVNASNSAGTGPFSVTWKFKTVISPPVAAPVLLAPPNGAVNQGLTPTLDWSDVFGTLGYKVLVSSDSLFNTWLIDTTIGTLSEFTIPAGALNGSSTYYWQVRGFNVGGFGPWSVTWRFSTAPIGINTISSEIPQEFKLYYNYPNPFNPVTKIRFDIPAGKENNSSSVKLSVYDITGREISVLLNRELKPGKYEALWDGSLYSSGIYFYRLSYGSKTRINKMVLLK